MGRQPEAGPFWEPRELEALQAEWLSTEHPVPLPPQVSPVAAVLFYYFLPRRASPSLPVITDNAS